MVSHPENGRRAATLPPAVGLFALIALFAHPVGTAVMRVSHPSYLPVHQGPPEGPQLAPKTAFRASKSCVCNVRRLRAIRLLTEGL
jgi:hypothetical protein